MLVRKMFQETMKSGPHKSHSIRWSVVKMMIKKNKTKEVLKKSSLREKLLIALPGTSQIKENYLSAIFGLTTTKWEH